MVDEYFNKFLTEKAFAPAIDYQPTNSSTLERYKEKLPDRLLQYWQEYGFCGYAEGLFWVVNPAEYEDILEKWMKGSPRWEREKFYVIARTAFGALYVINTDSLKTTIINPHLCSILPGNPANKELTEEEKARHIGVFFQLKRKESLDFLDQKNKPLFQRTLEKLGPIQHDEMYTFVPALASGGIADIKNIKIVKIHEQLAMLAELDTPVILPSASELFG